MPRDIKVYFKKKERKKKYCMHPVCDFLEAPT
jgi:hypothetical protein